MGRQMDVEIRSEAGDRHRLFIVLAGPNRISILGSLHCNSLPGTRGARLSLQWFDRQSCCLDLPRTELFSSVADQKREATTQEQTSSTKTLMTSQLFLMPRLEFPLPPGGEVCENVLDFVVLLHIFKIGGANLFALRHKSMLRH